MSLGTKLFTGKSLAPDYNTLAIARVIINRSSLNNFGPYNRKDSSFLHQLTIPTFSTTFSHSFFFKTRLYSARIYLSKECA